MIEKLKLSFCLSSDLGTPQEEEEATRYFRKERRTALETFASGLNLSSDEAGLLAFAKKYLETPDILHPLFEPRANKELATLAHNRIPRLFDEIDKVRFELTKEGVEPEAAFLLPKRLERLRAEFEIWREAIRSGNFEVYQTRPYEKMPEHFERFPNLRTQYNPNNTGRFPAMRFRFQWQPETAKVKKEPEEFRQIWLNPEEDIPFVLQALKDLEFIDEKEVWRVAQYPNPLGPIVALIEYPKRSFFHDIPRVQIEKAFCQRFNIERSIKGFKPENKPFENSKTLMNRHLKEYC
jgi:hypothetical protein